MGKKLIEGYFVALKGKSFKRKREFNIAFAILENLFFHRAPTVFLVNFTTLDGCHFMNNPPENQDFQELVLIQPQRTDAPKQYLRLI